MSVYLFVCYVCLYDLSVFLNIEIRQTGVTHRQDRPERPDIQIKRQSIHSFCVWYVYISCLSACLACLSGLSVSLVCLSVWSLQLSGLCVGLYCVSCLSSPFLCLVCLSLGSVYLSGSLVSLSVCLSVWCVFHYRLSVYHFFLSVCMVRMSVWPLCLSGLSGLSLCRGGLSVCLVCLSVKSFCPSGPSVCLVSLFLLSVWSSVCFSVYLSVWSVCLSVWSVVLSRRSVCHACLVWLSAMSVCLSV